MENNVLIAPDGTITFVCAPELKSLLAAGEAEIKRASHVIPLGKMKRILFSVIRPLVSDQSRIAGWTRTWRGPWIADLAPSGGPVLRGPEGKGFANRADAIVAEVAWLNQHLIEA